MNTISFKTGFWSALTMFSTFVVWIVCFSGIALTSPLFVWENIEGYADYCRTYPQFFQNLAKASMLVFGPAYVVWSNSVHENISASHRVLSRLGVMFGLLFAAFSTLHYFIQLSTVRLNIDKGITAGIEYLVQANPLSVMTAIDMLGWTLFLGLSSFSLFMAIDKNMKWMRIGLFMNGLSCLGAMVGYLFQIDLLTFTCINIGVGGAMLFVSFTSLKYFRRSNVSQ